MSRYLRCNVFRDGYEMAAAHVMRVIKATRGNHVVQCTNCGGVRVTPAYRIREDELNAAVVAADYIGTFNQTTALIEYIEDSFIDYLRDSQAKLAA